VIETEGYGLCGGSLEPTRRWQPHLATQPLHRGMIVYQDVRLQNARRAAGQAASNIVTVSVDEKPGVQEIANTAPNLPPMPGRHPEIGKCTVFSWVLGQPFRHPV
jgi:hypothetical protein